MDGSEPTGSRHSACHSGTLCVEGIYLHRQLRRNKGIVLERRREATCNEVAKAIYPIYPKRSLCFTDSKALVHNLQLFL